ncbi:MAG: putative beta-lysine N-acetyltransferase [Methanosarcinaceae archaeon]|nr:putative beta-lysine N-acetyltransferase [Methanosarcinaceae archaeon]MDF1533056.1 putative beta-lysine N-acetyltransferase [Methanosarcinaceae archaeon]
MIDIVTTIGSSVLQHGNYNDRIYLMKLSRSDIPSIIGKLDTMVTDEGYCKVIAKVPAYAKDDFLNDGYICEATIPRFFRNSEDVYFMAKYYCKSRRFDNETGLNKKVLETAESKSGNGVTVELPHGFKYTICERSDAHEIANVYKKVFETYPFPIHDPHYIEKTMDETLIYFCIWNGTNIVALASSEMDIGSQNVEMTDFATLPEYRGNSFSLYLLQKMEHEMKKKNMKTAYTIARAGSYGINIAFSKSGYNYSGTLINNTNISGNFESMNVWYKHL